MTPPGLPLSLAISNTVWEDISMDFIEGLPKSQGLDVVFVVLDQLTKYSHLIGLKHPFTAKSVAVTFIKEIVCLHCFPKLIVSDKDKVFFSHFS